RIGRGERHGRQTVYRRGNLKDRCEPILLFEQCASDLCTRSRDANQRGDVDRGCRSCGERHGRREVSSITSREPEGKLCCFLTDLVNVFYCSALIAGSLALCIDRAQKLCPNGQNIRAARESEICDDEQFA